MELNYLSEKEVVSFCFNNLNETAFILYKDNKKTQQKQPNNLFLVEEDFHYKIIKKQFKLLQKDECNITNQNYKKNLYDSYEGYSLYFWEAFEKLVVIYPFAYILIYDYNSTDLVFHSQCPGVKMYNIILNIFDSCCIYYNSKKDLLDIDQVYKMGYRAYEVMQCIQEGKDTKDKIVNYLIKFIF